MNRLRDAAADDLLSSKEIERLRNTPPTPPVPDMKRRVWSALQQRALAGESALRREACPWVAAWGSLR